MTLTQFLIAAAHAALALLAIAAAARHHSFSRRAARLRFLAATLFAVGLLHALNSAGGHAARRALRDLDLYHGRQPWQTALMIAAVAAAALAAVILEWRARALPLLHRAATWLVLFVALLCALRVVSYHRLDVLLARPLAGAPLGRLLEAAALAGLGLLFTVAICRARAPRHEHAGPVAFIRY